MNISSQVTVPPTVEISQLEHEAAASYISAIVAHDACSSMGIGFAELRTRQLTEQFVAAYTAVATGPYARRGNDALRLALGRI
jgi:hypothetical protein